MVSLLLDFFFSSKVDDDELGKVEAEFELVPLLLLPAEIALLLTVMLEADAPALDAPSFLA